MPYFNAMAGMTGSPVDLINWSQAAGQMSFYQGMNPYMGQVGQANGQMLADQANMMSAQIRAATRQQEELEPVLELQRKRSRVDLISDKTLKGVAERALDEEIFRQLGLKMPSK